MPGASAGGALSEFGLIERFFNRPARRALLGGGDDCALIAAEELAVTCDMLVSGTHFLPDTDPWRLGWKTLAVNVSDLAAMGAEPRHALLALALPAVDEAWLAAFADGFYALAERCGIELIGGDTTRGPLLTLSVTAMGAVPAAQALRRDGARPGDAVWVSGHPGRAALGLASLTGAACLQDDVRRQALTALEQPEPRVALGLALRGLATACIDVSDGLAADLGHILERSGVGADIDTAPIAADPLFRGIDPALRRRCQLAGGDDYELLFTAPPSAREVLTGLAARLGLPLTPIGRITADAGLRLSESGEPITLERAGYDHFA